MASSVSLELRDGGYTLLDSCRSLSAGSSWTTTRFKNFSTNSILGKASYTGEYKFLITW